MVLIAYFFVGIVYFLTLSNTIYGGDAGDLLSAILTKGFAHPPGYSLYTLIGILFNSFPFHLSPAGKVTLISTFSTIVSLIVFYKIIRIVFKPSYFSQIILFITLLVLGLNYIVWLYAIVPEVFPLNTLITLTFFYNLLQYYLTKKNVYLYFLALFSGLALSHHYTFLLVFPSVLYLFWQQRSKIKFKLSTITIALIFFAIGLIPNLQMYIATKNNAAIIWGNVTNLKSALAVLLRQGYGTFTAGNFITNLPQHRFLQVKNVLLYVKNDFTYLGIIALIMAFIEYFRLKNNQMKTMLKAVFINVMFFGPFFFFYANFPLQSSFFFATLERFLHIFYFFLAIFIYLGIWSIVNRIKTLLKRYVRHVQFAKLTYVLIVCLFFIYPIGQYVRNVKVIASLKNDKTAENLGNDVMNNVPKNSIILLSGDTILFDTLYAYYASPNSYQQKILVHTTKLLTDFYQPTLIHQYPSLRFNQKHRHSIEYFIDSNKDRFSIYSNVKYPLILLKDYSWVPQGLLYKLAKNSEIKKDDTVQALSEFWNHSYSRKIVSRVKQKDPAFKNLFLTEVLRIYSVAHQNTAYFLLQNNLLNESLTHISESIILEPDDSDNHFLKSKYFAANKDCSNAEKEIAIALTESSDDLYINQLKDLGESCFTSVTDTSRIKEKLKQLEKNKTIRLRSF